MEKELKEILIEKVNQTITKFKSTPNERFKIKEFNEINHKQVGESKLIAFYHPVYKNVKVY